MEAIPQQIEQFARRAIEAAQKNGDLPDFEMPESIPIIRPKQTGQGDYACPIAMALAKVARQKPLDIANAIHKNWPEGDSLPEGSNLVERIEVAPPGFINMWLSDAWVRQQIEKIIAAGEEGKAFHMNMGAGKKAQVEFVSANPTGPLTIGRTRGAVLGDALAHLLEVCGWNVQREYYFNNAGRQMELLGRSLKARYLQVLDMNVDLPEDGYQGNYLITIAEQLQQQVRGRWADKDWPEFKEHAESEIFKMIRQTLSRLGIAFDQFFAEQTVYDDGSIKKVMEKLRENGHVYEAVLRENATDDERKTAEEKKLKPATWFRSTTFGDDEDRVVIKSSGEPTYVLPDIAYHVNKLDRGFDRIIDIFGTDHVVEARTVERGLKALNYDASKVDVILHQFVTFKDPESDTTLKMSTRKGHYVLLDDLLDDVGSDVTRYFMIGRSENSHIEFDLQLAREQSQKNPVYYIQNAHVRCCGIFRQVQERGYPENWDAGADLSLLGEGELAFIRKVLELPEQIQVAYDSLAPHMLAFYTLDLARLFHPLYDDVRVLHGEVPEDLARARLRFYRLAKITFAWLLGVMGMSAPERM